MRCYYQNTTKKINRELLLPYIFLAAAVLMTFFSILKDNPDTDTYFLIENGRQLWQNGIVHTNTWNIVPGMSVIIQQPLCSLLNFAVDELLGIKYLWVLAILMNGVLMATLYWFLTLLTTNRYRRILVTAVTEIVMARLSMITTRPYQITMALSILMLGTLVKWSRKSGKEKETVKARALLITKLFILTMLQVNYQASFVAMMAIWPLCFITGDILPLIKEIRNMGRIEAVKAVLGYLQQVGRDVLLIYPGIIIASLINPYGIDGALYLMKSKETFRLTNQVIQEMALPPALSFYTLLIALLIVMLYILYKREALESWLFYLGVGTIILQISAARNAWMLMIAVCAGACALAGTSESAEEEEGSTAIYNALILLIVVVGTILSIHITETKQEQPLETITALKKAKETEEIRLYTNFTTGSRLVYEGFQVFMEARPEIYTKEISGGEITREWILADVAGQDIEAFIEKYQFNYFAVSQELGYMWFYLKHSPDYELIASDDFCYLYKRL